MPEPGQRATFILADGTELLAERRAEQGNPGGLRQVAPEELAACSACYAELSGATRRLRINSALGHASELVLGELRLSARSPSPRRIRWDVLALPAP